MARRAKWKRKTKRPRISIHLPRSWATNSSGTCRGGASLRFCSVSTPPPSPIPTTTTTTTPPAFRLPREWTLMTFPVTQRNRIRAGGSELTCMLTWALIPMTSLHFHWTGRAFKNVTREPKTTKMAISQQLLMALIVGGVFVNVGELK